jgi:hypothetical protein
VIYNATRSRLRHAIYLYLADYGFSVYIIKVSLGKFTGTASFCVKEKQFVPINQKE